MKKKLIHVLSLSVLISCFLIGVPGLNADADGPISPESNEEPCMTCSGIWVPDPEGGPAFFRTTCWSPYTGTLYKNCEAKHYQSGHDTCKLWNICSQD